METLYSCLTGSALFGTSTPESDLDRKLVFLPKLDDMLLGRKLEITNYQTNEEFGKRNSADDIDEERIPVQTFALQFLTGQTYALEMAFAADGDHAEQTFHHPLFKGFLRELRAKWLMGDIKAMMGFVIKQASMYSIKGDRLKAVEATLSLFEHEFIPDQTLRLVSLGDYLEKHNGLLLGLLNVAQLHPKYFSVGEYSIDDARCANPRMRPCLRLLETIQPYTSKLKTVVESLQTQRKKYGARSEKASKSTADWKATMHAARVLEEGIELLQTGKITLPRPPADAERLLTIKRGEVPIEDIKEYLDMQLEKIAALEVTTALPKPGPETNAEFNLWLAGWMRKFYGLKRA